MIEQFRVDIPQPALDDLKGRLDNTRWPAATPDVGWARGVPLAYMKDLVAYWRTGYDWRRIETRINEFPQYVANIDATSIHFLHVRSPEPDAVPMVMTTGWPSSFLEYLDVIGPLTDPRAHGGDPDTAVHLVIPSLPGFGFSTPLTEHGWTVPRTAGLWGKLMAVIGYDQYLLQGADWGSFVSLVLAAMNPGNVRGCHVNFLVTPPQDVAAALALNDDSLRLLDAYMEPAPGYMTQHASKPQTLSYGLNDSPVGQLAWYVEKYHQWSGAVTSPEDVFDKDALLDVVSLYWLTGTAGTAAHYYCDNAMFTRSQATPHPEVAQAIDRYASHRTFVAPLPPVSVPVGVAIYPDDIMEPIRQYADEAFPNIVHWERHERGGHFPALEAPEIFVEDIWDFRRALNAMDKDLEEGVAA